MADGMVLLGDFKDIQSKTLFERQLWNTIKPKVGSWVYRSHRVTIPAPYRTATFAVEVHPKGPKPEDAVLIEGVTPGPTGSIAYVERTMFTKPYGFYTLYTDQERYAFYKYLPGMQESIRDQANDLQDQLAASQWFAGNNVWETEYLTDKFITRVKISLQKFSKKKGEVICLITPEDLAALRIRYNTAGANLFVDTTLNEESVKDAKLVKFQGVYFEEEDSPIMYNADGTRTCIFYTADSKGRAPVSYIPAEEGNGEFIHKGLSEGDASTDPLNQRGSIGVKFQGLGAMITSDECLARVKLTDTSDFATVESEYDYFTGVPTVESKKLTYKNQDGSAAVSGVSPLALVGSISVQPIATTATVTAVDTKGVAVAGFTLAVADEKVATVEGTTITAVADGVTTLTVSKDGYASWYATITVKKE